MNNTSYHIGVGKIIDSSMHCNIIFPIQYRFIKSSESIQARDHPHRTSRSPPPAAGSVSPATSLKGRRVMRRGNIVGAAEAGSQCLTHCSFGDSKLPAQQVSPWPLHRAPTSSTLLRGESGVQCQLGLGIVKNLTIQFHFDSLGRNSIQYQFDSILT